MTGDLRARREAFYGRIDASHCTPLWEVLHGLITPTPSTPCQPCHWPWETMWPYLRDAGSLISAEEAERRVLVLENPGLRGRSRITHSLYAGLQLILPGEVAPPHRHSQSAMRFVLRGKGAYTAVDGRRIAMEEGDFVITPSWAFHDHGNPSDEPMVWLDGLDVPIVELFDAQFMEKGDAAPLGQGGDGADNLAAFGVAMKPVGFEPASRTSPLCWYPYARSREALLAFARSQAPHPCWGHKLQYVNPVTGGWPMPTMGTFLQYLPAGFDGAAYRSTDATVYAVREGSGTCRIDGRELRFGQRDVFVCPSWMPYTLHADADTVLFSFSDRPAQQSLDIWRELAG
ncbi:MAG: gentisate 1,2-dioxygenase [Bordetella sp. SCN 67-23]|nr:gentisate 1,2-dioxygenase [Burkholderiales bacterium]ODS75356.1 MAG: gentisate 1,2-dioxygenase [Bordetella sp. SCN 67-23]OJW88694.1 MAG: gentisate 1,2-dioxygenase [Burkholderiales bacterium 67-32]